MVDAPDDWQNLIQLMISKMNNNSIASIIGKIGIAACVYNIWKERNFRIFQNIQRTELVVLSNIKEDVKWKIMSLKMKNSTAVRRFLDRWSIPVSCVCVSRS